MAGASDDFKRFARMTFAGMKKSLAFSKDCAYNNFEKNGDAEELHRRRRLVERWRELLDDVRDEVEDDN